MDHQGEITTGTGELSAAGRQTWFDGDADLDLVIERVDADWLDVNLCRRPYPPEGYGKFEQYRRALCAAAGVDPGTRGWGEDSVRNALRAESAESAER